MKKKAWINYAIIAAIIIISIFILSINKSASVSKDIAKCIVNNSLLYVTLGCTHCENQEKIFGKNIEFLNITDCWYEGEKCTEAEITNIPTWVINGEKIIGKQSIEELQNLTGC